MVETGPGRIETLRKKLEEDPGSKLFLQLAEAHRENGDNAQAVEVCRKGLERNPCYHSARVSLGRLYLEAGRNEEATQELRKVLEQIPGNLLAQRLLERIGDDADRSRTGTAAAATPGDEERGEPNAMSATEPDPLETETLAEMYLQQGHPDQAVRIFERILREKPDNESIRRRLDQLRDESAAAPAPDPDAASPSSGGSATAAAGHPEQKKIAALEGWLQRIQKGQGND